MLKRPKTIILLLALAIAALIVFWPSKLPKTPPAPNSSPVSPPTAAPK